jgi:hypothetical protein
LNRFFTIIFLLLVICACLGQASSPLQSGKWYKFSVTEDGIYKLDYNALKKTGINPDQIDPKKIAIYTTANGMLPQLNSASRINQLREIAIKVTGDEDGKFNKDDLILFYGQGPDEITFLSEKNTFSYANHLYSDKNFYFLTISDQDGKRVGQNENVQGNFPVINQYDDFTYYENDKNNILTSGRDWFGERFNTTDEVRIQFDIPGIIENTSIKIISQVMGMSQDDTSFKLYFNNIEIGEQKIKAVPNAAYAIVGRKATDTISFSAGAVNALTQSTQEIKYQYIKSTTKTSDGYLDFITIQSKRKLNSANKAFSFVSSESLQNQTSTFQITSFPSNGQLWEVSDPFQSNEQVFSSLDGIASFSTSTINLKKFFVFTNETLLDPTFEILVNNQNLINTVPTDLLIVTHPDFKTEALRLAAHRQSHNNLTVLVATTDEIYNEYSGGKPDITAIRDFARSLYVNGNLKNLLLLGRCSYDYKDRINDNTNFVPTYESRNSLSPLETYSSDDYFGFFDSEEGDWTENPARDHSMEIGVGRLSVKKLADATNVVDKLIAYDVNQNAFGKWRKDILFVADDGDFNIHQSQSNQLADEIELNHPQFNTNKLFLDSFKQSENATGPYSTDATNALTHAVNKGALIVNFTGHGSETLWMQERILSPSSITEWKNKNQFPLFVTATCEFGRHDDPDIISSAELILIKKNSGAIGLVTTARPVNSSTNFILNKSFYSSLFEKVNDQYKDLGTIFRDTKNRSLSGVSNRNFSLLGDPSMKLAVPEKDITIDEITTANHSDTLKALSNVTIKGVVINNGITAADFSGVLEATLFDKQSEVETLGNENPVFTYKAFDHIIFQGKASIVEGKFEMDCVVPVSIAQEIGNGKLSLYARTDDFTDQSSGAFLNFKVGGSELLSDIDTEGPAITLFMGDTTYQAGGAVATNTHLIAILSDEHGINISGYKRGDLEITLDDSITYIGNTFYEASLNDFRNGIMSYPITGLPKGNHTLSLNASDTYGNVSQKSISFSVGGENQLIIDSFNNYPNPVPEKTTFQFSHNRPGEDLEAQIVVYNSMGQVMNTMQYSITESFYNVTLTEWDATSNGIKLNTGIYFVKLLVRSLADGAKNEKLTKLIVLN